MTQETTDALEFLRAAIIGMVRQDGPDLTMRQLAVVLIRYLENGRQTPLWLAIRLNIPTSAISRALDRLAELHLVSRQADPANGRSALIDRTPAGEAYMAEVLAMMAAAEDGG